MKSKLGRIVPRWMHQAYAFLLGYFWEPCPICKRKFGGHEWNSPDAVLMVTLYDGKGVCSDCAGEAGRRNKILFAKLRDSMTPTGPAPALVELPVAILSAALLGAEGRLVQIAIAARRAQYDLADGQIEKVGGWLVEIEQLAKAQP